MGERFADKQSRAALWTGAVLSVGTHLLVGVMVAGQPSVGRHAPAADGEEPRPRVFEPPAFRLGEDQGDPTAIAWLGYEEFRRHVAQPWTQDQAAFTPSASTPGPLPPAPDPLPPPPPAPEVSPTPEETLARADESTEAAPAQVAPPPAVSPAEVEALAGAVRVASDRARDLAASTIAAIGEAGQSLIPPRPQPTRPEPDSGQPQDPGPAAASEPTDASETPEPVAPAEPVEVAEVELAESDDAPPLERPSKDAQARSSAPRPVAERSPGSGLPGEVQDREAIAASIERATRVEWGQPLAAAGLRVATVRPRHITPLTRQTTRPADPVVRVHFGADGQVREAVFLRSSGHRNIDQPILDAVYQWTASGKPLSELDAGNKSATLVVDFRIAL